MGLEFLVNEHVLIPETGYGSACGNSVERLGAGNAGVGYGVPVPGVF